MGEPVMTVAYAGHGLAAVCSTHGPVGFYTNHVGAAFAAIGHATTFHGRTPERDTLRTDRPHPGA